MKSLHAHFITQLGLKMRACCKLKCALLQRLALHEVKQAFKKYFETLLNIFQNVQS